ncbi:hypothetical protein M9Y10_025238 [Tritrichomonas musculus]|uniref:Uncharacterized protein n=1 Tax=Tritrichomonas musculus TaxID=1915356 RepID=A0ABR2H9Y7_9EUKA
MIPTSKACRRANLEATLCGCFADCSSCCYTTFCYPCAVGKAWADSRDEPCQCCHCGGLYDLIPTFTRANIRHARGIPINYLGDCCMDICCPCCFTVQNLRELKFIRAECQVREEDTERVKEHTSSTTIVVNNNNNNNNNNTTTTSQTSTPPPQAYTPPPGSYPPPGGYPPQAAYPPQEVYPQPPYPPAP